ncbi:hypothetical protein BCF46_3514 [Litoreibacter meonggei]|uniref:Uncharacterized protein n=1 Tax=Litoreibacter meonggei TaxID=1049199 RepID=A0A497VVU4_9RHOB|nr:hypothetical protein [Litoreibacter meonggei]RLJ40943.1 hypothetical protein BCF46_3514 [Litoreibacter meonggei]
MADYFVETQNQCPIELVQEVRQVQRATSADKLQTLFGERQGFLPSPLCSRAMVATLAQKVSPSDRQDYSAGLLMQMLGTYGALSTNPGGDAYLDEDFMGTVRSAIERMRYHSGDGRFAHLYFPAARSYGADVDPMVVRDWTFRPADARFSETWAHAIHHLYKQDEDTRDQVADKLATVADPNHLLVMLQNVAAIGPFARPLLATFRDDPRRPDNGIAGWELDTIGQEVTRMLAR